MSVPELRRLMVRLATGSPIRQVVRWSRWRRHHQAIARQCHINRRQAILHQDWSL